MQITIIAGGSRGDVQPYVALGKGLKDAEHRVRILTSDDFQSLVADYGLDFFSTGGSAEAFARGMRGHSGQGNTLKTFAKMRQASQQQAIQAAERGLVACQGSDLILGGLSGLSIGVALAEKLNIPYMQAYLVPFTPTQEFSSVLTPLPQTPLTRWLNKPSHRLAQQILWQSAIRPGSNQARTQVLQMAPSPFWGPFASLERQKRPVLYGYSPQVLPHPKDWDDSLHVTGYWFLEPPVGWKPPQDLMNFLQSGPPPVYIGFGSMASSKPEEVANIALQALARTGQRGVLYEGWGGLKKEQLPEGVFMTSSIPHTWLFPRMAAVVHHGGVGTTAAGLAAGVPSIITPFFADQPFWGQRAYELGVGPKPIPQRHLNADNLTQALDRALSDREMRKRAAALGERIRAENGIAQAMTIIEQSR
ncbi:MAG: glycosyltransferase family 1 protein [Ktedonobacteraceae bacterium]|nr:glycosyltransferase family 1 protein [Ktedonobacteraceae bacterium]